MKYFLYKRQNNQEEIVETVSSKKELNLSHNKILDQIKKENNLDYSVGLFIQTKDGSTFLWKNDKLEEIKK